MSDDEPCQHSRVYVHPPIPTIKICADCGLDLSDREVPGEVR